MLCLGGHIARYSQRVAIVILKGVGDPSLIYVVIYS